MWFAARMGSLPALIFAMENHWTLLLAVALSLVQTFSADWPEFRGPTGQGHASETRLPLHWSKTNNVAWKQAVPGLGWSSPVVVEGKVFLTTAVAEGKENPSLRTLCLDALTGKILWNTEIFSPSETKSGSIHNKNTYASPTPLIHGGRIYVHYGHHGTACVDLKGKVLWRNNTLKYSPVHGSGASPAWCDGKIVFSVDGASDPFIVALDAKTGTVAWKVPRESSAKKKFSFVTPLVIEVKGKKQIITPGSGVVSALDPKDGREIWRATYGEGYSVVPRPVFGHGLLFIATGFDRPTVIAIRPDGQGDVTQTHVAWTLTKGAPNTPSLLLSGKELYMVSDGGIASCVDALSGQPHWQERVGGNYSASPLLAGDRIYLQSEEGVGTVIKAAKSFEVLATNNLEERSLASCAAADGGLFIRTLENIYRLSQATP